MYCQQEWKVYIYIYTVCMCVYYFPYKRSLSIVLILLLYINWSVLTTRMELKFSYSFIQGRSWSTTRWTTRWSKMTTSSWSTPERNPLWKMCSALEIRCWWSCRPKRSPTPQVITDIDMHTNYSNIRYTYIHTYITGIIVTTAESKEKKATTGVVS